jgi:glycerol-3-phosphate acyltransferase PlsY
MLPKILLSFLFGYIIGTVNPAYIIGRLRGFDIRQRGSRNAGASNALITMGKWVGILSAIFDIFKASAAYWLAPVIFKDLAFAAAIAGAAAIIGHIFPFYMKFRGGKGTACLGGLLIAIDWRLFLIMLAIEVVIALVTDYLCLVPITASIVIPLLYGFLGSEGLDLLLFAKGGWISAGILSVAMIVILLMNITNIKRMIHGSEMHFSFAWSKNKDAEIARVQANEAKWAQKRAARAAARKKND